MTLLHKGQKFTLNDAHFRVAYVNASRAHCVSADHRHVTVRDAKTGTERTFRATARLTLDISPGSQLDVLKEGL